MYFDSNWAVITPLANEEKDFDAFISEFTKVLNKLGSGKVYLVVDKASKDRTLELCRELSHERLPLCYGLGS
jgi:dolichol-phosphate mannosyltransferase